MDRESLQVYVQPYSCSLARVVDFWGVLTNASCTRSTVSADGPGRLLCFAAHRQPLWWNFMYHSRIVLSVGDSVWYMIWNLRCTVTIDSVLVNSKTQNAFLFTVNAIFRHDYPLAVEPASTPRPLVQKKFGEILYILICSFLPCLSWLLCSRVRKSQRDLWITLYIVTKYLNRQILHIQDLLITVQKECNSAGTVVTFAPWPFLIFCATLCLSIEQLQTLNTVQCLAHRDVSKVTWYQQMTAPMPRSDNEITRNIMSLIFLYFCVCVCVSFQYTLSAFTYAFRYVWHNWN